MHRFSNSLSALMVALTVALTAAACTKPDTTASSGNVSVGIGTEPHPAELGDNRFRFWVKRDGKPMKQATVRWRMFMPGMPMNSDATWIEATADGSRYSGIGDFSMGGDWQVLVQVTPADAKPSDDPVTVSFSYPIEWKLK